MAKGEFVRGILFGHTLTRLFSNASTICTILSSALLIYDTNSAGVIDMGYFLVASAAEHEQTPVRIELCFLVEVIFAGSLPHQRTWRGRGGVYLTYDCVCTQRSRRGSPARR